jgi:hypothetical protein
MFDLRGPRGARSKLLRALPGVLEPHSAVPGLRAGSLWGCLQERVHLLQQMLRAVLGQGMPAAGVHGLPAVRVPGKLVLQVVPHRMFGLHGPGQLHRLQVRADPAGGPLHAGLL